MKQRFILLGSALLITMLANAQKGSVYVGGHVGFNSSKNKVESGGNSSDLSKTTTWTLSPEVGTFLTDHVQLGVGFNIGGGKTENYGTPGSTGKNTVYGATLYSRYFFGKEAFKPFVGINVSATPGKTKTTIGNTTISETKDFTFGTNLNAGFGYALSSKVTAVGSFGALGFSSTSSKNEQTDVKNKSTSFGIDANTLGNRFTIGVYFTL